MLAMARTKGTGTRPDPFSRGNYAGRAGQEPVPFVLIAPAVLAGSPRCSPPRVTQIRIGILSVSIRAIRGQTLRFHLPIDLRRFDSLTRLQRELLEEIPHQCTGVDRVDHPARGQLRRHVDSAGPGMSPIGERVEFDGRPGLPKVGFIIRQVIASARARYWNGVVVVGLGPLGDHRRHRSICTPKTGPVPPSKGASLSIMP